jgi:hypothetical protein
VTSRGVPPIHAGILRPLLHVIIEPLLSFVSQVLLVLSDVAMNLGEMGGVLGFFAGGAVGVHGPLNSPFSPFRIFHLGVERLELEPIGRDWLLRERLFGRDVAMLQEIILGEYLSRVPTCLGLQLRRICGSAVRFQEDPYKIPAKRPRVLQQLGGSQVLVPAAH